MQKMVTVKPKKCLSSSMFSLKMKWVKLAESTDELRERLNSRTSIVIELNGQSVLLVTHQGEFYLVKNRCPHQGSKLEGAECEEGKIVCPWHRYAFDLKTGRGAGLHLENYPIEAREDGLYVGFEYFSWF